ncbi:MAG: T9SS C-terminal target domain-containing protein [Chitinophagaceae bacterium]|nr:MAG: T9SS C-terminal target domain-containing protein [Chitinophagaceae bacterium]
MMNKFICFTVCLLLNISFLVAQPQISLTPFASGISNPIEIEHANDERLFIVSRPGVIYISDSNGDIFSNPFLDISSQVMTGSERGLLGLAFHPDFQDNGYFYVCYSESPGGDNVVSRFSVDSSDPDIADPNSEQVILTISQPAGNHNGGDILFGHDGYLYIAVGDGGGAGDPQNNSQNPQNFLGTMLRIDVDNGSPYAVPSDNPFFNDASTLDEIWALGLRNHWRNSFDRVTGDLWIADVGQSAIEEVNFQAADSEGGQNYGWRCYEGSLPYNLTDCGPESDYTFPAFEYEHYGGGCSGSITGGFVYRGALFNGLYGKYLAADYCKGDFYWVEQTDTGFASGFIGTYTPFQYVSFGEDVYGELYIASLTSGTVEHITDTSDCRPAAVILSESFTETNPADFDSLPIELEAVYHPSLEYQWFLDNNIIPGATSHVHLVNDGESGTYSVMVTNPDNGCDNLSEDVDVFISPMNSVINDLTAFDDKFSMYPNPASNQLTLEFKDDKFNDLNIRVLDVTGRTLIESANVSTQQKLNIDTENLIQGVYFLSISTGNKTFNSKFQVVR